MATKPAKSANEVTLRVLVSFDGFDVGQVFTTTADQWVTDRLAPGYLEVVTDGDQGVQAGPGSGGDQGGSV